MKKRFPLILGASLIGLAGSLILRKKKPGSSEDYSLFEGDWRFYDKNKELHTLAINKDYSLIIDDHAVKTLLVELNMNRLVFQDEYGYHLIIEAPIDQPAYFYDEADDERYKLYN
ncbi:hypothetical protein BAU15_06320 [Enterococcus sp. JM4C]|uniref:DUF4828 domain-containing protein n=1 Tax=Candidatus Enterococcus huntleyi TaxID=1857217 RepID=UPI00137AC79B|nr:DUF4828 domain-containing protein [Enterococcus sp. JM4C]KAF1297161.1 hypothetical protein BAU15_06320 [Enterococcus sp. JM4C]